MTDVAELLRTNLHGVFGQRDADARRAAAAELFSDDVRFTDPEETVSGREALLAKAAGLLEGAPGFVFREDGPAYVGTDRGAQPWSFGPEDGEPVARGVDIIALRGERIVELVTLLVP